MKSSLTSAVPCPAIHPWLLATRHGPNGPPSAPVLIAGGGPAGLAAAAELAHHGVGCVVIEPRAEVSHRRPRAKTTSVRTMEHLRRWGVAGALRAAALASIMLDGMQALRAALGHVPGPPPAATQRP